MLFLITKIIFYKYMKKDLNKLFDEYITEVRFSKRLSPKTILSYRDGFNNFKNLMPHIVYPSDLSQTEINEFFRILDTRKRILNNGEERVGVKDSTIMAYWNKLNSFFVWLKNNNHIENNPLDFIRPKQPIYDDKRALTQDEVKRIITAIEINYTNAFLKKRDLLLIYTLVFCGLRKNELISLEVTDIDLEKRTLRVRSETSKSKRTREMPINPKLISALKEYFEERKKLNYTTKNLFASYGKDEKLGVDGLKHLIQKMVIISKVKFHLHRFRHTFACNLSRLNVGVHKMQLLLGHTDIRMTQRYLRSLGVEDLRDDINKLNIDYLI